MSKICSNFAVENEFLACQNRVTNSHKILILNKIIADLQQVTKINSTVGLSGFESWLSNIEETFRVSFLLSQSMDSDPPFRGLLSPYPPAPSRMSVAVWTFRIFRSSLSRAFLLFRRMLSGWGAV